MRTPPPRLPGSPWQPSPSPRDASTRGAPRVPATSPPRGPRPAALARPCRPAPGPAPPGRTHLILEPMVPGPPHGPAGPARRCAARPPAADRPPSGALPAPSSLPSGWARPLEARSLAAAAPVVNVLAPARRTPWSPARVPGARRPLHLPRHRPLPPAPPPPAGAAGNCSPLAGAGAGPLQDGGGGDRASAH